MTSSNSRCATFTNEADGCVNNKSLAQFISNSCTRYVPSEGAAGLILKTKSAAIRDGDNILAIVRSTDIKHDADLKDWSLPMLKLKLPYRSRSSRKPL